MRVKEVMDRSNGELAIRSQIAKIFITVPEDEMCGEILQVVLEAVERKYGVFGYIDEYGAFVCSSMKGCHWVFNIKGILLGVNDSFSKLTGYSREELLAGKRNASPSRAAR
jgi:PAS domain-containing protein